MSVKRLRKGLSAVEPPLGDGGATRVARVSLREIARLPLEERRQALEHARAEVDPEETESWDAASGDGVEEDGEAEGVVITEDTLTAELSDGRTISVPLAWYPRLAHGTEQERANWRLVGGGQGIYWPELDEDASVEGLLAGRRSGESRESLRRWLEAKGAGRGLTLEELRRRGAAGTAG